jgi:hypothetical protein
MIGKQLGVHHPFFLPRGRRVGLVVVLLLWAVLELITGGTGWAILAGCLTAACGYEFFIAFDAANYTRKEKP